MESTVRQYEVTDDECEWIKPYFTEGREWPRDRPASDFRKMLNGICYILRNRAVWRDLPERSISSGNSCLTKISLIDQDNWFLSSKCFFISILRKITYPIILNTIKYVDIYFCLRLQCFSYLLSSSRIRLDTIFSNSLQKRSLLLVILFLRDLITEL